jgi:hypothetical protein
MALAGSAAAGDQPMVCRVGEGVGTLIAPRWVLTAAHVAESLTGEAPVVRFGEQSITVSGVFVHPEYGRPDAPLDLALIELALPVPGIPPAPVDTSGVGTTVIHIPGCGGPDLVRRGDSLFVIGVNPEREGGCPRAPGATGRSIPLAGHRAWMEAVFAGKAPDPWGFCAIKYAEENGEVTIVREESEHVPMMAGDAEPVWRAVRGLLDAYAANDTRAYLALMTERARAGKGEESLLEMFTFMRNVYAKRGPVARFHALGSQALRIPDSEYPLVPVVYHFPDGLPGYFGLALDPGGRIDSFSLFVTEGVCPGGKGCAKALPLEDAARLPESR